MLVMVMIELGGTDVADPQHDLLYAPTKIGGGTQHTHVAVGNHCPQPERLCCLLC